MRMTGLWFGFMILLGIIIHTGVYAQSEIQARIVFMEGTVQLKSQDDAYKTLEFPDRRHVINIDKGDTIRTGAQGLCEIEVELIYSDPATGYSQFVYDYIRLYNRSTLRIEDYSLSKGTLRFLAGDIRVECHRVIREDTPFALVINGHYANISFHSSRIRMGYDGDASKEVIKTVIGQAKVTVSGEEEQLLGEHKKMVLINLGSRIGTEISDVSLDEIYPTQSRTIQKQIEYNAGSESFSYSFEETVNLDAEFHNHFDRGYPSMLDQVYYDHYVINLDAKLDFDNRLNRENLHVENPEDPNVQPKHQARFVYAILDHSGKVKRFYLFSMMGNMIQYFDFIYKPDGSARGILVYNSKERPEKFLYINDQQQIVRIDHYFEDGSVGTYETEFRTSGGFVQAINPAIRNDGILVKEPPHP